MYDARIQHCWQPYAYQTNAVGFLVASMHA